MGSFTGSVAELFATLGIDISPFIKGLSDVDTRLLSSAQRVQVYEEALNQLYSKFNKSLSEANAILTTHVGLWQEAGSKISSAQQQINTAQENALKLQIDASRRQQEIFARDLSAANEQIRVEKERATARAAIDNDAAKRQQEIFARDRSAANEALRLEKEITDAERARVDAATKASKDIQAARDLEVQQLRQMAQAAGDLGRAGLLVFAPIAAASALAVHAFAEFDAALNRSTSIMLNVSALQRGEMAEAARELARVTLFSAKEAAAAFYNLGTSGLSVAESLKALPVVANFAMASNMSLEKATTLLTQAQTALGLRIRTDSIANMQEMARVADLLVAADQRVAGSAQQFAEALTNKAAAALNLVNKSAEEGVAVLAALAEQGIVGAKAGDYLYRALRDIGTKATANSAAFKQLGIDIYDANGKMLPMAQILLNMQAHFEGLSDRAARADLNFLKFTERSASVIQILMKTGERVNDLEKDFANVGGTAKRVAEQQLQTFEARMTLLQHRVNDVAIVLGKPLAESILGAAAQFDPLFKLVESGTHSFSELDKGTQQLIAGLISGTAYVGTFASGLLILSTYALNAAASLTTMGYAVGGIGGIITALGRFAAILAAPIVPATLGYLLYKATTKEDTGGSLGSPGTAQLWGVPNTAANTRVSGVPPSTPNQAVDQFMTSGAASFAIWKEGIDRANKAKEAFDGIAKSQAEIEKAARAAKKEMADEINLLKEFGAKLSSLQIEKWSADFIKAGKLLDDLLRKGRITPAQYEEEFSAISAGYMDLVSGAKETRAANEKLFNEWETQGKQFIKQTEELEDTFRKAWLAYEKGVRGAKQTEIDANLTNLGDRLQQSVTVPGGVYDQQIKLQSPDQAAIVEQFGNTMKTLRALGKLGLTGDDEGTTRRLADFNQLLDDQRISVGTLSSAYGVLSRDFDRLSRTNLPLVISELDKLIERYQEGGQALGIINKLQQYRLELIIRENVLAGKSANIEIIALTNLQLAYEANVRALTRWGELYASTMHKIGELTDRMVDNFLDGIGKLFDNSANEALGRQIGELNTQMQEAASSWEKAQRESAAAIVKINEDAQKSIAELTRKSAEDILEIQNNLNRNLRDANKDYARFVEDTQIAIRRAQTKGDKEQVEDLQRALRRRTEDYYTYLQDTQIASNKAIEENRRKTEEQILSIQTKRDADVEKEKGALEEKRVAFEKYVEDYKVKLKELEDAHQSTFDKIGELFKSMLTGFGIELGKFVAGSIFKGYLRDLTEGIKTALKLPSIGVGVGVPGGGYALGATNVPLPPGYIGPATSISTPVTLPQTQQAETELIAAIRSLEAAQVAGTAIQLVGNAVIAAQFGSTASLVAQGNVVIGHMESVTSALLLDYEAETANTAALTGNTIAQAAGIAETLALLAADVANTTALIANTGIIAGQTIVTSAMVPLMAADVAATTADVAATTADTAATIASTTSEIANTAAEVANTAALVADTAATGAAAAASTASGAAGLLGGATKAIGGVLESGVFQGATGLVSAVTDVLGYLQGRRMEQDIGRIEVTTRGQLNQLISIQGTLNTYLPELLHLTDVWAAVLKVTDLLGYGLINVNVVGGGGGTGSGGGTMDTTYATSYSKQENAALQEENQTYQGKKPIETTGTTISYVTPGTYVGTSPQAITGGMQADSSDWWKLLQEKERKLREIDDRYAEQSQTVGTLTRKQGEYNEVINQYSDAVNRLPVAVPPSRLTTPAVEGELGPSTGVLGLSDQQKTEVSSIADAWLNNLRATMNSQHESLVVTQATTEQQALVYRQYLEYKDQLSIVGGEWRKWADVIPKTTEEFYAMRDEIKNQYYNLRTISTTEYQNQVKDLYDSFNAFKTAEQAGTVIPVPGAFGSTKYVAPVMAREASPIGYGDIVIRTGVPNSYGTAPNRVSTPSYLSGSDSYDPTSSMSSDSGATKNIFNIVVASPDGDEAFASIRTAAERRGVRLI